MSIFRTYKDIDRVTQDQLLKPISNDNNLLNCDFCSKSFINDTELEVHRRIVHGDALTEIANLPYSCKMCIKNYENEEDLIKHTKTQHLLSSEDGTQVEKEIFVCHFCNQIFFSKSLLTAHIGLGHMFLLNGEEEDLTVECPKCHKWVKLINVALHLQGHMYDVFCCCPVCMELFNRHEDIYLHAKSHPSILTCECGLKFTKYSLYNKHRSGHNRKILHNKCSDYKKYFATHAKPGTSTSFRSLFKQMMLNGVVLPKCVNVCVLCKHICTNAFMMKYHINQDHYIEESQANKYVCDCGMEFTNKVLLKKHQLSVHTAETYEIAESVEVLEFYVPETSERAEGEVAQVNNEVTLFFS